MLKISGGLWKQDAQLGLGMDEDEVAYVAISSLYTTSLSYTDNDLNISCSDTVNEVTSDFVGEKLKAV